MKRNEKKDKLFMGIMMILCLLLFFKRITGEVSHVILGIFLLSIIAIHIYRQIGKIKYKQASVQMVDRILFLALAVVFVSGILLHPLQGVLIIRILHKVSSVIFALGMIIHVLQHKCFHG